MEVGRAVLGMDNGSLPEDEDERPTLVPGEFV